MNNFLKYFLYIIGYMAAWAIVMFLVLFYIENTYGEQSREILFAVLGFLVVILVSWIPFMQWAAKRVFVYPGKGTPVEEKDLRREILDINNFDAPVRVIEKGKKLVVSWNYVDAKWFGLLSKSGLSKHYELRIRFNDKAKTATLVEVQKEIAFGVSPGKVTLSGGFFRGICMGYDRGIAWGITENYKLGKIYDYTFSNAEIKDPVMNTINNNGWTVNFGMW